MKKEFDVFFKARSVVIIGLSPNPGNLGRNIIANSRRWGYEGKFFGVSPSPGENDGVAIFKSLDCLPEKPELAVVFTKANLVPEILLDCARYGLRHIAVSSAGFEETGKAEGIELAEKIKKICREKGLYLVGPNGIATANTQNGLCLSFMPLDKPAKGRIAFITQSGGIGTGMATRMKNDGFPLGKFVSLGNKTVLDEIDFLEYFAYDSDTDIICFFLEDLRRAREFIELAKTINKPIIIYKANNTPYGAFAASTHTGALKNDEAVMDGAFRQAGIIRAYSVSELINLGRAFLMPPMKGNRLLIISPSGGMAVIMSDLAYKYGFELPPIPQDISEKYSAFRRAGIIDFKNPVDFGDIYSAEVQRNCLRELLARDDFDGLATAYIYRDPETLKHFKTLGQLQRDLVAEFNETIETIHKPVGLMMTVPYRYKEELFARSKYPIYDSPEEVVYALARMRDYFLRRRK